MALFDKLFSLKRKLDDRESRNRDRSCEINPEQVRLLLFKECDWRGRKLLFDSATIQKVPSNKNDKPTARQTEEPSIIEVSEGFTYLYKGPSEDAKVLGEMIFGAVAMNCKNVSLKIHIMDEPRRLMCTKVFCVPTRRMSRVERKPERREESGSELADRSVPLSVPLVREEGVSLSFSLDRGDSGFYGDSSPYSSVSSTHDYFSMFDIWDNNNQEESCSFHLPPGRKLSTSSNGSWHRRTFQNMATRFDIGQNNGNLLEVPTSTSNAASTDSQLYSNSSTSGTSDSIASTGSAMLHRKNKLGLALLISVTDTAQIDVVRRCLEHSPQLQALACRLRLATLSAGASRGPVSTLYRAAEHAASWLSDLVYGPRLQPVWLSLVTSESKTSNKLAESLLSDLCAILSVGDTKSTNFFISTLLTHVLTYHLGWVCSVSPFQQARGAGGWEKFQPELRRALGAPPRAARTIISGPTKQFLHRLLVVLTYFLRSEDVRGNEIQYNSSQINSKESKVVNLSQPPSKPCPPTGLKRSVTRVELNHPTTLNVPTVSLNTQTCDSNDDAVVSCEGMKRSSTLADFNRTLSSGSETLRRNPTVMMSLKPSSDSSLNSSLSESEMESEKVVFVLGDNDKLVGLKNKSIDGKSGKKTMKVVEPVASNPPCARSDNEPCKRGGSPAKCCSQTLQHSKPIKHSGFKFEFDKYPQIVTNYMKSKNLEILDRHYIGKPGNLKLDNFQFDPTVVPQIPEETTEPCVKCQMLESMLQTPTNASEMEYMNDIPRQSEPQYAKESIVEDETRLHREVSPKTFVRRPLENTLVINVPKEKYTSKTGLKRENREKEREKTVEVSKVLEFEAPVIHAQSCPVTDMSLLGGVTDHYVPDLVLQGTIAKPKVWELELRRDLDLTSFMSKTTDTPLQAVAIVGDVHSWEVRVIGRDCGTAGMSSLVGAMLDTLPAMWKAKVPAQQCISFIEGKLRELCVLSKTLADMLMSTDFCDIATLTKSLNIDMNDVPLLLAVATTHTPQVAYRYGLSYG